MFFTSSYYVPVPTRSPFGPIYTCVLDPNVALLSFAYIHDLTFLQTHTHHTYIILCTNFFFFHFPHFFPSFFTIYSFFILHASAVIIARQIIIIIIAVPLHHHHPFPHCFCYSSYSSSSSRPRPGRRASILSRWQNSFPIRPLPALVTLPVHENVIYSHFTSIFNSKASNFRARIFHFFKSTSLAVVFASRVRPHGRISTTTTSARSTQIGIIIGVNYYLLLINHNYIRYKNINARTRAARKNGVN